MDSLSRSLPLACAAAALLAGSVEARQAGSPAKPAIEVAKVGLMTPESMLHDERGDVYLVSNINGAPSAKDGNGFISRVSPDGTVAALKWIEGGRNGVTLHAPKGLALHGDTLFASDIDCVRRFNRATGAPVGETCIDQATFLNDVSVAGDGTVYVSDTGVRIDASGMTPTKTDAVYRIGKDHKAVALVKGTELMNPNGVAAMTDGVIVVPFGGADVWHIDASGAKHPMGRMPAGQLDGVIRLADGTILASSWEGKAVYRMARGGQTSAVVESVASPADIGYDAKRRRLLIPVFTEDRLIVQELP
jgi:sugar lactone lactonase YvrE